MPSGDAVRAVIEDDGAGFDPACVRDGALGLVGIRGHRRFDSPRLNAGQGDPLRDLELLCRDDAAVAQRGEPFELVGKRAYC